MNPLRRTQLVKPDRTRVLMVLIGIAAVLPSALVFWFMNLAISNEQLARQQLQSEALRVRHDEVRQELVGRWQAHLDAIDLLVQENTPAQAFAEVVGGGLATGLVVMDPARGLGYPTVLEPAADGSARAREPAGARAGGLAREPEDARAGGPDHALGTAFARLREQHRAGNATAAIELAEALMSLEGSERLHDSSGRHLLSSIELYLAEHDGLGDGELASAARLNLIHRLNRYDTDLLPAAQRRFLMSRIVELDAMTPDAAAHFPTLQGEQIAAAFLERDGRMSTDRTLEETTIPTLWRIGLGGDRGVALFSEAALRSRFHAWLGEVALPADLAARITVRPEHAGNETASLARPLHETLPDWRLSLARSPDALASPAPGAVTTIYLLLSIASAVLIAAILVFIARYTASRMALAQQRNTMVATVSHELKTPVSAIKVLVDSLLQDPVFKPSRARAYMTLIARENARLGQTIENFLSFSRIERRQLALANETLNVTRLIDAVAQSFRERYDLVRDAFTVRVSTNLYCKGDYHALTIVLLNLLDNAYKYADSPRAIDLNVAQVGDSIEFAVSDNGIGIAKQDCDKVFEQFFRADHRLSRNTEGCGLGLYIVRQIVALHHGDVDLRSSPGRGCTFTITLPSQQHGSPI